MIKDIIIHVSAGPHARLPDTDSQDLSPNTGNSPGRRYPAPRPLLSRLGHRPARPRVLHRQHQEPSHPQGLRHRRPRLRRLDGHHRHRPSPLHQATPCRRLYRAVAEPPVGSFGQTPVGRDPHALRLACGGPDCPHQPGQRRARAEAFAQEGQDAREPHRRDVGKASDGHRVYLYKCTRLHL